jgi:hypothetical protein
MSRYGAYSMNARVKVCDKLLVTMPKTFLPQGLGSRGSMGHVTGVMDEFYHDWRIRIDDTEGPGIMVFAPNSNYGTPIIAENPREGLRRAIAYIDRQIAPQVSLVRAAVEDEARNYGLDYSQARKRVGI